MDVDSLDTDNRHYILYPSGSHGHFLKLLLNTMVGNTMEKQLSSNFDKVIFQDVCKFETTHDPKQPTQGDYVINIRVNTSSYLKFFVMCFCRTKDLNIDLAQLGQNTFEKIDQHPVIKFSASSLSAISGCNSGDVEPKFLREWFRLCFFANDGDTITKILAGTVLDRAQYVIDFESFYDGTIMDHCTQICHDLRLDPINHDLVTQYVMDFGKNNTYFNIDEHMDQILLAIQNRQSLDLTDLNILQQAWIDNYLVGKYNIDPLLTNDYFTNTKELINAYGI